MKILTKMICLTGFFLMILTGPSVFAQSPKVALALKGGTLGAGLEATVGIIDNLNARLGFNYFSYDDDFSESGVEYEADLDLRSLSLLLDWHPLKNGFRLSAGALYNGNEASATGKATSGSFSINDVSYTAAQVGTLRGEIDFNSIAPYVGIGYGNAVNKDSRWNFVFDLGVIYQGEPDVTLTADGTSSGTAAFISNLEQERQQLESEIEDFQFYPVIMIGVSYRF